jgi:hypothetical protein
MITEWIDKLAAIWEISDGRGGTVRSYRVFERAEFPEGAIQIPGALTYPNGLQPKYGQGTPTILLWEGITEFHLVPNMQTEHIPYMVSFYQRILAAALANMKLSNTVEYFILPDQPRAIEMAEFLVGEGPAHRGLLVHWSVKENVSGDFTITP